MKRKKYYFSFKKSTNKINKISVWILVLVLSYNGRVFSLKGIWVFNYVHMYLSIFVL